MMRRISPGRLTAAAVVSAVFRLVAAPSHRVLSAAVTGELSAGPIRSMVPAVAWRLSRACRTGCCARVAAAQSRQQSSGSMRFVRSILWDCPGQRYDYFHLQQNEYPHGRAIGVLRHERRLARQRGRTALRTVAAETKKSPRPLRLRGIAVRRHACGYLRCSLLRMSFGIAFLFTMIEVVL